MPLIRSSGFPESPILVIIKFFFNVKLIATKTVLCKLKFTSKNYICSKKSTKIEKAK